MIFFSLQPLHFFCLFHASLDLLMLVRYAILKIFNIPWMEMFFFYQIMIVGLLAKHTLVFCFFLWVLASQINVKIFAESDVLSFNKSGLRMIICVSMPSGFISRFRSLRAIIYWLYDFLCWERWLAMRKMDERRHLKLCTIWNFSSMVCLAFFWLCDIKNRVLQWKNIIKWLLYFKFLLVKNCCIIDNHKRSRNLQGRKNSRKKAKFALFWFNIGWECIAATEIKGTTAAFISF